MSVGEYRSDIGMMEIRIHAWNLSGFLYPYKFIPQFKNKMFYVKGLITTYSVKEFVTTLLAWILYFTFICVSNGVCAKKGGCPTNISKRITPTLHQSHNCVYPKIRYQSYL